MAQCLPSFQPLACAASALDQKCLMDRAIDLAVDLKGNVMTRQNMSGASKYGIGGIGSLLARQSLISKMLRLT